MRRLSLAWLVALGCASSNAPPQSFVRPDPAGIRATVLLIGDAGAPVADDPVLAALGREIARDPATTTVVFLGDNIYPHGMPDSADGARSDAERRIDAQAAAAAAAARVVFIPGNHDWDGGADDGWSRIRSQARYLSRSGTARLLPEGGCPGPAVVDPGPGLRLVLLDTEWWLHGGSRPGPGSSSCAAATPEAVERATADAIRVAGDRAVIVAGHHPLVSTGPHGGRFGWTDHVFPLRALARWAWIPLPVIGSAYPIARMSGISRQDQSSSIYRSFRDALVDVFSEATPLVYVAGHEHGLEVRRGPGAAYTVTSGGGSTGDWSTLRPDPGETLFSASANGFVRIDVYGDGRVRLTVIVVNDERGSTTDAWGQWLR